MSENIRTISLYLRERFPLLPVFLFAIGYATLSVGTVSTFNIWLADWKAATVRLILFTSVFFFFLLRQRVVDEFRDTAHDQRHFPDRPVPRGLVSKNWLIILGFIALTGEYVSVFLLGKEAVVAYSLVFFYSLLMAKEFFISDFLNRHFTLYFLIHEVVFILFGVFFIVTVGDLTPSTLHFFMALGVLAAAPMSIEIIRKFSPRYNKKGGVVPDTYSTVWGRTRAFAFLIALSLYISLSLVLIKNSFYFLLFSSISTIAWVTLGFKSDKMVKIIGVINFLNLSLLSNLIW